MNKRIQQLAEQAGLKYYNWITNESNIKDGDFKYPRLEDLEKFAELIIQECLLALEPDLYESDIEYKVDQAFYKKCERIIKKHFVVKE